ncbi:hypothetical protein OPT61_g457 [Boeremia exigua]|uniref:Uncharacterized protein n=1 Tax=Boeremia exigua TaxID=749465 RepID=A0ACC2ITN2_9PLEO|nr:hypothetical protein OPT61_g457 [Boeremia exigua]
MEIILGKTEKPGPHYMLIASPVDAAKKRGRKRKHQTSIDKDTTETSPSNSTGIQLEHHQEDEVLPSIDDCEQHSDNHLIDTTFHEISTGEASNERRAGRPSLAGLPSGLLLSTGSQVTLNHPPGHIRSHGSTTRPELLRQYHAPDPTSSQRSEYACLASLLPHLEGVVQPQLAHKLLQLYFAPPEGTLFHNASPYVLTPILRKDSVLNPASNRSTTPALLATMIWVSAQTASLPQLLAPGSRATLCCKLQDLVFKLLHERDLDNWQRVSGRLVQKAWYSPSDTENSNAWQVPSPVIDDVICLILISIVLSGGDFKRDSLPWWNKAVRLIDTMQLHQMDHPDAELNDNKDVDFSHGTETCRRSHSAEAQEEMRRTFWLAFALDRHLALSYNGNLSIVDGESHVYIPIPERIWQSNAGNCTQDQSHRQLGPPAVVTGTGFFEFFLPLMVLLGDIINLRRRRHHPRLGTLDDDGSIALLEKLLERCKESIDDLQRQNDSETGPNASRNNSLLTQDGGAVLQGATPGSTVPLPADESNNDRRSSRTRLVTAYAHFILHVLFILLHGEWDALTMLAWLPAANSHSEWITSSSFHKCSSHAVFASEAISSILRIDPELIFMPYLFGIYLFHGSLVLLLFADRMPAVHGGSNDAVEAACETIIRAHEACIVTLNTEFQRVFKRVMRATLMVVKDQNKTGWPYDTNRESDRSGCEENAETVREKIVDTRKEMLRLYRWNQGGRGLAI